MTELGYYEIFTKNKDLAGRAVRSKNDRIHFKLILFCFSAIPAAIPYVIQIELKTQKFNIFADLSILVGWAGRSKRAAATSQFIFHLEGYE